MKGPVSGDPEVRLVISQRPAPPAQPNMTDTYGVSGVFADRFAIEREIGRGATAVVYAARDAESGELVAVKVLRQEVLDTAGASRFLRDPAPGAGLPRMRLYDLRHSSATLLLALGVNAKVISERLGHADPAFTLRVYARALQTMQQDAP